MRRHEGQILRRTQDDKFYSDGSSAESDLALSDFLGAKIFIIKIIKRVILKIKKQGSMISIQNNPQIAASSSDHIEDGNRLEMKT